MDLAFHFDLNPDLDPSTSFSKRSATTCLQTLSGSILSLHAFIVSLNDSRMILYTSTLAIYADPDPDLGFDFDGNTDFHSSADPDPASKIMRIRIHNTGQ
jgi:hypothetical protein